MCVTLGADSAEGAVSTGPGCVETASHPPQVNQLAQFGIALVPPQANKTPTGPDGPSASVWVVCIVWNQ